MKKVLLIVAIAFVVLAGGCVGCVALDYRAYTKAMADLEPAANDFVGRWNDRDLPGLYALAGGGADRAAFDARTTALLDRLGRIASRDQQGIHVNSVNGSTTAIVSYQVRGERGDAILRLTFADRGGWTIIEYALELGGAGAVPAEATKA
jgi:hypothetical protein